MATTTNGGTSTRGRTLRDKRAELAGLVHWANTTTSRDRLALLLMRIKRVERELTELEGGHGRD